MRVIQTKNDTIRLIFNPKGDSLCLGDFLIVRDGKDNFLGQVIEIFDDKFNLEENVANIKLIYRILEDRQVVPYDNFTPSRECEIAKIKIEEIEKCLNADKTTVPFGIFAKNNKVVNINLDFFNNNPVVFADKLDEVNIAFENIAQKLKPYKKVVAIDYTGNLNIKNAKRIKAPSEFKLPLDFDSLEYIKQKALINTPLEDGAELEDMFIELQKFVCSTEDKYIPYPRFIKVIEQQYKATPALELKLLLNRLKRYFNDGLFARSKKEFQGISKALSKEDVVIVDFSGLKLEWHREFLECTARQLKDFDCYVLLRLNENNSNPEIINNLYVNNKNLNLIPAVSYGFPKLPSVMEYTKNYILYRTLNQRKDFGFVNCAIESLNSRSFIMYGEDTMDFMFILKNYIFNEEDLNKDDDKKIYIDLNLELEEMTSAELLSSSFEIKNMRIQNSSSKNKEEAPSKRLDDEVALDDVLPARVSEKSENDTKTADDTDETENPENITQNDDNEDETAEFQDIPLVKEEKTAEYNESDEDNPEDEDAEEAEGNLPYTLEEVGVSSRDLPSDVDIVSKHLDSAVEDAARPADDTETLDDGDADVAELIEASLKNDEEYIKEIEKGSKSNPRADEDDKESGVSDAAVEAAGAASVADTKDIVIPVPEEDLDYFINPSADEESVQENKEIQDETAAASAVQTAENKEDEALNQTVPEAAQETTQDMAPIDAVQKEENSDKKADIQAEHEEITAEMIEDAVVNEEINKEFGGEDKESTVSESILLEDTAAKTAQTAESTETVPNTENTESTQYKPVENQSPSETGGKEPKENRQPAQETIQEPAQEQPGPSVQSQSVQHSDPIEQNELLQTEQAPKEVSEKEPVQKEPVIIVKEKPNLVIDDFSEPEPALENTSKELSKTAQAPADGSENTPQNNHDDGVSLHELAQKSIEARFDEVMGETKDTKAVDVKKNELKITDGVSIDLEAIKNEGAKKSTLPVFDNTEDDTPQYPEYDFQEGMKVSHEKYGEGVILKVVKYSNRCLLQIDFTQMGKRLLDPKIAKIKPLQ